MKAAALESKRRALSVAVGLLLLWPFAHYALVQRYDINAWKLAGWAMYSRLGPTATVEVAGVARGVVHAIDAAELPEGARAELHRYLVTSRQLGLLASPEPLLDRVLAARLELDAAEVRRDSYQIDRVSDRLIVRRTTYARARGGVTQRSESIVR